MRNSVQREKLFLTWVTLVDIQVEVRESTSLENSLYHHAAHSNFVAPQLFFIYRALWVSISQNFFCILHSIFECMGCRLTFIRIYIFFSPRLQQMCYIIFKRKSYLGNRDWVCMIAVGGVVRKSQIFHIKSYILIFNMGKGHQGLDAAYRGDYVNLH